MIHHLWPVIGFWKSGQPIVGLCGYVPLNVRPWCSYVVLPQPKYR